MNAAEFMAGFSSGARREPVTLSTIGVCSTIDLKAKVQHIEDFAERTGCPLIAYEIELCAAIRAELKARS